MIQSKTRRVVKITAWILPLLLLILAFSPAPVSAGVCEKAVAKCGADAVLAGMLSGLQTFIFFSTGCIMGYTWCLQYYV